MDIEKDNVSNNYEVAQQLEKKTVKRSLKKYKNRIIIVSIVTGTAIATYLLKDTERNAEWLETMAKKIENKDKYSLDWIHNLSDEQWETEREIVRKEWCSGTMSTERAYVVEKLLDIFDRVYYSRHHHEGDKIGPAFHREHGWYLPNND